MTRPEHPRWQATALEHHGKQAKDPDIEKWGAQIKLRAIRRLGEISAALPKYKNQHPAHSVPMTGQRRKEAAC